MKTMVTKNAFFWATLLLSGAANADAKGEQILREAFRKLGASPAMTAKITQTLSGRSLPFKITMTGNVAALKPNLLRVRIVGEVPGRGKVERVYAATGSAYLSYFSVANNYRTDPLAAKPTEFLGEWEGEIDAFFGGEANASKGVPKYSGTEKVGDTLCDVIKMTLKATPQNPERIITYCIGQTDKLIHKASYVVPAEEGADVTQANILSEINLNAKLTPKDFQYAPPKGARSTTPPRRREVIRLGEETRKRL